MNRVSSIADPSELDPVYAVGLERAVAAAVDYGLEAIDGRVVAPPIPVALLGQARMAARNGVGLDVVMRRYVAGGNVFVDFLIEEAAPLRVPATALRSLLAAQASAVDTLTEAIGEEYRREIERLPVSAKLHRARLVEGLLGGQQLDPTPLAYDFDLTHIGLLASGHGAAEAVAQIARRHDCRLLLLPRSDDRAWAWLGARRLPPEIYEVQSAELPEGVAVCFGEPGEGLGGWRLSHHQAIAASAVLSRGLERVVRYGDVALIASVLQDKVLTASLRELYLEPLRQESGEGETALETLRAYFECERQLSSAAAALGVNRKTVANRLRRVEERIGRPLASCSLEIEAALRIDTLGASG